MPAPQWLSRDAFTALQVGAIQAGAEASGVIIDASEGSTTLALVEGNDSVALWLQAQAAQTVALTRAATCSGADLDGWMADWFFTRLPAVAAAGAAAFTRLQNTAQVVIAAGSLISTGPGGQQFAITTNPANPAWSAALNGYVLAAGGATSILLPIAAVTAGSAGNVLANTITSFVGAIVGIDSVTNAAALTSGLDAESDAAFRARFPLYLASLRQGTAAAIQYAVESIQQGVICGVLANQTYAGTTQYGFVTVVVDDGTGSPPSSLLAAANAQVLTVLAEGMAYGVFAPTVVTANIGCTVASIDATKHAVDIAAATNAIDLYVNTLPRGTVLPYARLYQVIFDSSANISAVTGLTLNGGTADLLASAVQVIKAGAVTVH
jgi:uncharacterized phage protein gp47/JayE